MITGGGPLTNNTSDSYMAFGMSLISGTESNVEIPIGSLGSTITDLQVRVTTPAGTGASWTLTIDKNGTATGLTCQILGATQTTCSDASLVAVASGDTIDLDVTPFGSPALATLTWSAKITP